MDYSQSLPLHHQVSNRIRSSIESGEVAPGDALPPEEAISSALDISRSTVRLAMSSLVKEGLLVRVQGKGTFVSNNKMRRRMEQVYSFSYEMNALGKKPSSVLLGLEEEVPDVDVADRLQLADSEEKVWRITRIRCADLEPLLIETTFIPCRFLPEIDRQKLEESSLYDMLRDHGTFPSRAEETYESIVISDTDAELLGLTESTTGFYIERCSLNQAGVPYELTHSVMRGDRSKLVVNLEQCAYSVGKQYHE